jgi:hypothetical protein
MNTGLNRKATKPVIASILFVFGLLLLSINIYGLFADIRKENLDQVDHELLRFTNDNYMSYSDSIKKLKGIEHENPAAYAQQANRLVQQSLTHIEWDKVDPKEFRQLVPIWENYLLHFIGIFFDHPQIERYHFVDYKRSLQRGIGICGDASMVLSQILDKKGVDNQIISYQGHVITQASIDNNKEILLDPDFGVELNMSLEELTADPSRAYSYYLNAGYSEKEARTLVRVYGGKYTLYDDVYAFMPKRYIFEYLSYVLKWLIPICMLLASVIILRSHDKESRLPVI